ncbi:MAG TPA: hypothetical protein VH189_14580 [Rhizomicrobium sp.]|jgi:hypothetical protein|nr:hypothetical protein [Rhizomicrobium sp.]
MTFCRRNLGTALRAIGCGLVFWAFLWGQVVFPLQPVVVVAFATMLGLLVGLELLLRGVSQAWVLGGMLLIDAVVGSSYLVWRQIQPPVPTGPLLAANDPTPSGCGDEPKGSDLLMAFGTDRVLGKGPGPFTPILVDECVALKLLRRDGGLMVQAFGYSYTEDIAFHVMDNVYEPDTALKMRALRPDRNTFVLLDRFDKEVLYVRYLNPRAVRIRGRFLCGNAPQAVIRDDAILVGGVRLNGVFVGQHAIKGHACAITKPGAPGLAISGR